MIVLLLVIAAVALNLYFIKNGDSDQQKRSMAYSLVIVLLCVLNSAIR